MLLRPHCYFFGTARQIRGLSFTPRNDHRSTCLPQMLRLVLRVAHCGEPGTAQCRCFALCMSSSCLARRRVHRLRDVTCTSCAPKRRIDRESILQKRETERPRLRRRGSAKCIVCQEVLASLHVERRSARVHRRRTTQRRSRQAAECRARRPSRLMQRETDGVTPLADAQRQLRVLCGKRRAACPLAFLCGLQLNV